MYITKPQGAPCLFSSDNLPAKRCTHNLGYAVYDCDNVHVHHHATFSGNISFVCVAVHLSSYVVINDVVLKDCV